MRHTKIASIFTIAATVVVAAGACASSGTTGSGSTGSGDKSGAAGAAGDSGQAAQAMTLLAKMTAPQAVAASTKAVASKQSAKVHMTISMPMMSEDATGAMSFGSTIAADLSMKMSSSNPQTSAAFSQLGQMEMRMTGLVAYIDMGSNPQIAAALQGKSWMKIDFANLSSVPALKNFSFMKDMGKNNDPSMKLKALLASPNLKKVGEEQRGGVQTLHFSGTVDPTEIVKASAGNGLTQQDVDSLAATAKQAGVTATTYDVWVDGDGLPVEIKFSEDTKAGAVSGDISYSDWGTPVSVTAPPADQTVDMAQLMQAQAGGGQS